MLTPTDPSPRKKTAAKPPASLRTKSGATTGTKPAPERAGKNDGAKAGGKTGEKTRDKTREKIGAAKGKTKEYNLLPEKISLRHEIMCIILIAAGLLLILSLFTESGAGALGGFFNSILKGLFGFGAYMLPFIVIGTSLIVLFSKQKYFKQSKIIIGSIIFLIAISLINIFNTNTAITTTGEDTGAWQYVSGLYKNGGVANGGLFGGLLGDLCVKVIGTAGSYILLITSGTVLLIILTGKSLFSFIMRVVAWADGRVSYMKEKAQELDDRLREEDGGFLPIRKSKPETEVMPDIHDLVYDSGHRNKDSFNYVINEDDALDDEEITLITDMKPNNKKGPRLVDSKEKESRRTAMLPSGSVKPPKKFDIKLGIDLDDDDDDDDNDDGATIGEDIKSIWGIGAGKESEEEAGEGTEAGTEEVAEFFGRDISVKGIGIVDSLPGDGSADYSDVDGAGEPEKTAKPPTAAPLSLIDEEPLGKRKSEKPAPTEEIEDLIKRHEEEKEKGMEAEEDEDVEYCYPPLSFLRENTFSASLSSKAQILENSRKLESTLKSFGVEARVVEVSKGPAVTRYELSPGTGVKVNKIASLSDDLALNLAAEGIRIEAPIPGKSVVGIEIPNKEVQAVLLREVIDDPAFSKYGSKLAFAVGKDIAGNVVVADIAKMPHLLIAGSTGSGKSVCINTIITSILYKANPDEVKLLMIDPKVVELSVYNGIPHLLIPVVTDPKKAAGALNWAVQEMDSRYNLFAETVTRDLKGYNEHLLERGEPQLPQIVIVIDELADLMMTAKADVETAICRIAQKARAAGIHLVIATQRPSVDVITGLIKTNVPSRLAFAVASGIDSRTILDMVGAEKLMGKGDMLFSPIGTSKPQRIQGAFISDKEVENIVNFLKRDYETEYDPSMVEKITSNSRLTEIDEDADEFLEESIEFLVEKEKASVSMLQRRFRIGYNRAARLMEELEARGIVGPEDGSKPRKVLMTPYQWEEYRERH